MQVIRNAVPVITSRKAEFKLLVIIAVLASLMSLTAPSWEDFSLFNFGWLAICFGLFIVYGIALAGFQRVIATSSQHMHSLRELLNIGKNFFWRLVGLSIICGIPLSILITVLFGLLGTFSSDPDNMSLANFGMSLILQIVVGTVICIASATLITKDYGIFQSIGEARKLKIRGTGIISAIVIVSIISSISEVFPKHAQEDIGFKLAFLIPSILAQIGYMIVDAGVILIVIQQLGTGKTEEAAPLPE